ncbi:MAG: S9 family peptidase, partial [Stenotrophomonas acidaminiphila]
MRPALLALLLPLALVSPAHAQTSAPLTIEQAMAEPDWIGPPVERAWWAWDGRQVQYELKRDASLVRDTFEQALDGSAARRVGDDERAGLDAAEPVYDASRQRMLLSRNGDLFVRDLRNGALTQITRTNEAEQQARFAHDGAVIWRTGTTWYRWTAGTGTSTVAELKAERDPLAPPKADALREQQLRTIRTLADDRAQREAAQKQAESWRKADPTRAPAPIYLGTEVEIESSSLSPNGRWLLVVTRRKGADAGQGGKMPKYVTESGYEEFQDVRTRVGRNAPLPHALWRVDLADGSVKPLAFDPLPGIDKDPLASLRKAAGKEPLKGNRDVRVEGGRGGDAVAWTNDGTQVAVQLHAVDNKDRWIATVDLAGARLVPRHRLTDAAWINWGFNEFGWLPDNRTLWLLSEESGYSHLYTATGTEKVRARTTGKWEVSEPEIAPDGNGFLFLCNRDWPGDYEVCKLDLASNTLREVTSLDGVESFSTSP